MPCCDTGRNIQKYKGAAASTLQDVTDNGNTTTGDIITTSGFFIGDGSLLTGISGASAAFTLQETSDRGNTTSNVIQFTNTITSLTTSGNVLVTGNVNAFKFYGDGLGLTSLNASNINSGTLSNTYGGTGVTSSTGSGSVVLNTNPTLSGTITGGTFSGSHSGDGSGLSSLNADNISSGTLSNDRLGTKTGTGNIVMSASPTLSGTITGGTFSGSHSGDGSGLSSLNADNISSGTLSNDRLGTKTGTGNIVMSASPTLSGTITGGTFSGSHSGDGSGLSSLNADNISSGTLSISRGGTGVTTYTTGDILIASGTNTLSNLGLGQGGYVLTSNSTTGLPEWKSSSDLGTEVAELSNSSYILGGVYNGITSTTWSVQASNTNTADYIVARDSSGDIFVSNVNAINIRGDGSGITNSNASNISLGTLAVTRGGTGVTSSTGTGSVVLNTNPALSGTVTAGTFSGSGSSLTSLNASNINSGTLSNTYGGTGFTSYSQGDLLVGTGTGSNLKKLPKGNSNYVLTVNSLGSDIEWAAASGGSGSIGTFQQVTDTGNTTSNTVQFQNSITSLTASGNVLVTGNVTASKFYGDGLGLTSLNASNINSGTLSNAYGGTGFTSYSQGDLLVGTGTGSNLKKLTKGNANYVLTVNSLGSDIEWVAASGVGSSLWTQSGSDIYYDSGNVGISNSTTNHTVHLGSNVIVNDTGNYDVFRVNGNVFTTGHFVGDGSYITGIKQIKNETDTDVIVAGDGAPTRSSLLSRFYN